MTSTSIALYHIALTVSCTLVKYGFHPCLLADIKERYCYYREPEEVTSCAWFMEKDDLSVWLCHTKIFQNGRGFRLEGRDINSDSVLLSISHITWTSSYPHVWISSWSFRSPAPFFRALTRAATANQTLLTGKTILCHQVISLVLTFLLLFPPPTPLPINLNPARPSIYLSNNLSLPIYIYIYLRTRERKRVKYRVEREGRRWVSLLVSSQSYCQRKRKN